MSEHFVSYESSCTELTRRLDSKRLSPSSPLLTRYIMQCPSSADDEGGRVLAALEGLARPCGLSPGRKEGGGYWEPYMACPCLDPSGTGTMSLCGVGTGTPSRAEARRHIWKNIPPHSILIAQVVPKTLFLTSPSRSGGDVIIDLTNAAAESARIKKEPSGCSLGIC